MKNTPQRMCVVCRELKDKKELIRVVKKGDVIDVDFTDKAQGRGAYVCNNKECISKLGKTRALNRAFKCEVLPDVYKKLEDSVNE